MSYWNGRAFLRFLSRVLFRNRGTNYRLTAKRVGVLLLALVIYLPAEFLIWTGLWLDDLFYPQYRKIALPQPVFIIGNPRSGTTFLQRTLAQDQKNFHCLNAWEIFGAPSITMRRFVRALVRLGRAVGIPVSKRIRKLEWLWKDSNRIHRFRLISPEEDEYLFIHNFSTMKIWSFAALEEESDPYIFYDEKIPRPEKERTMDFYESCIRRHYYYHGGPKKRYLSKNPNFTPAIATLQERFPEAKFIYLVRNPIDAVPSHISLKDREWHILGSPLEKYGCREFILRSSHYWYDYPLEKLAELPEDRAVIVEFDDLVSDAKRVIEGIYGQLGLKLSLEFQQVLDQVTERARNHESKHDYSLEAMGLDPQQMRQDFSAVFDQFEFEELGKCV